MAATPFGGACRICGAPARRLLDALRDPAGAADGVWTFVQCSRCDFAWLHPPPADGDLAAAYARYYTHTAAAAVPPPGRVAAAVLQSELGYRLETGTSPGPLAALLGRIGAVRDSVSAGVMYLPHRQGGRLLDIGCGSGAFLHRMQQLGWSIAGVEPDAAAVAFADPSVRPHLHTGTVEAADFAAGSFDAITLHHVIEHLPDPVATLTRCADLLAPGGQLVALTPNVRALGRRIFGRRWLHWDPPRHLHLFGVRSLREAAARAGLRPAMVRTTARGARWSWRASRSGAAGTQPGRARGIDAVLFQLAEHSLLPFGVGEELVLQATIP